MIDNIVYSLIKFYSNTWYGIGIAVILAVMLLGIIIFLNSNKKPSVLSYAIALVLIPLLSFQMSRLYGSIALYCDLDDIAKMTSSVSDTVSSLTGLSKENTKDVMAVASAIPGVSDVIGAVGGGLSGLTEDMVDEASSYLKWYMLRRVLWSLLFIILSGVGIALTMQNNSYSRVSSRSDGISSGRSHSSSRRHRYQ